MTMEHAEWRWELVRDLWNELELEDVLARIWPLQKQWQLDLLSRRMRAMDEIFEDYEIEQLMGEEG
jgi:hypothetical protein